MLWYNYILLEYNKKRDTLDMELGVSLFKSLNFENTVSIDDSVFSFKLVLFKDYDSV